MQAAYPNPWYAPAVAYEILLQRAVQAVRAPDSFSVTIDDMSGATPHGNQYKYNLTRQHGMLQRFGSRLQRGLSFVPLEGRLRFTDSAAHHLIQVADVVAYNVFRQFRDHGEAWEDDTKELPVYDYFDRIASKFRKGDGGRIQGYGIVKFPLVKRVAWIAPPQK